MTDAELLERVTRIIGRVEHEHGPQRKFPSAAWRACEKKAREIIDLVRKDGSA